MLKIELNIKIHEKCKNNTFMKNTSHDVADTV